MHPDIPSKTKNKTNQHHLKERVRIGQKMAQKCDEEKNRKHKQDNAGNQS
ncbi:MAG TPA: hypothetical protein VFR24_17390 [Candidatus Angelobacter sp.]|nr:hypothetical protein [Candidatus Angelobacter sp.]